MKVEKSSLSKVSGRHLAPWALKETIPNSAQLRAGPHRGSLVIVVGIVLAAVLGACDTTSGPPGSSLKRPVELWTRGDDGLTQRFSEAFEDAIRGDTNLTLALGNEARTTSTIVATIQEHLNWKSVGPKTEVSYRIEFENATGKKLGNSIGSCWEDELQTCVNRALGDLRRAAEETN